MLTIVNEKEIDCDLFNADEDALVVTVNVVGAMGRGIALACKKKYPEVYKKYKKDCDAGLFEYDRIGLVRVDRPIVLFPTKKEFWRPASAKHIAYLCGRLPLACKEWGIGSIAIPPLGMVNGWLKEKEIINIVKALKEGFEDTDVKAVLYLPENLIELL
jgi:hypothetical protein